MQEKAMFPFNYLIRMMICLDLWSTDPTGVIAPCRRPEKNKN